MGDGGADDDDEHVVGVEDPDVDVEDAEGEEDVGAAILRAAED